MFTDVPQCWIIRDAEAKALGLATDKGISWCLLRMMNDPLICSIAEDDNTKCWAIVCADCKVAEFPRHNDRLVANVDGKMRAHLPAATTAAATSVSADSASPAAASAAASTPAVETKDAAAAAAASDSSAGSGSGSSSGVAAGPEVPLSLFASAVQHYIPGCAGAIEAVPVLISKGEGKYGAKVRSPCAAVVLTAAFIRDGRS
jgi:hypothetical protein